MLFAIYLIGVFIIIGICCWLVWHRTEDLFDDTNKPDTAGRFGMLIAFAALFWPVLLITLGLCLIAIVLYMSWYARDEEDEEDEY